MFGTSIAHVTLLANTYTCIRFGWGFKLQICTMTFCVVAFLHNCHNLWWKRFEHLPLSTGWENEPHFIFIPYKNYTRTYPIHSVWLDSIRFVSVPFWVYGNLWRYSILWKGIVDHPRDLRKMIVQSVRACAKFLAFLVQIIHQDGVLHISIENANSCGCASQIFLFLSEFASSRKLIEINLFSPHPLSYNSPRTNHESAKKCSSRKTEI